MPVWVHRLDLDGVLHQDRFIFLPGYAPPKDLQTFEDKDIIEVGGLTLAVRHTPGHSPGSCCFSLSSVLFTGDTLFAGDIGRVDLPGGSPGDMRRTLEAIAGWEGDFDVYPGHGEPTTLAAEQRSNPYLQPPFRL